MADLTPQQFVDKWAQTALKETASAQQHFLDVCRLVGHDLPAEIDPTGEFFTFEAGIKTTTGSQGYADVWYKDHFAIEYKGKGKHPDLDAAYQQLLRYRENLGNPPLLIVCDIEHWEIHTNFTGTEKQVYRFTNDQIATSRRVQRILHDIFFAPYQLHPDRTAAEVTADAASVFGDIAGNMRAWEAEPARIARFLTKLVFCLFAEDVGLLPMTPSGKGLFTEIVEQTRTRPSDFVYYTELLFQAMRDGGKVMLRDVKYFDGRLFDDVVVETLSVEALTALERACKLDWSAVEPAIFGTLFERSLDPAKRAQLGAHYTSRDDILLIVEPVLMEPLRREWEAVLAEAEPIRTEYDQALTSGTRRVQQNRTSSLLALREQMLEQLRTVTVLDPACGSGNFLYVALQLLKDLEKEVILHPLWVGLPLAFPEVHPRQLFGIEINPIAHDLASIVVWIGYIQWQQNNGYLSFREPILEPLDNIRQMDAILAFDEDGNPVEPEWPAVDVIVSNPPFLGAKWMQRELGPDYRTALFMLYDGRVSGTADLVTYWFEKARAAIAQQRVTRVGLLATNTIRQGGSAETLQRIKETGDIFFAQVDHPWSLAGADLRVALIGFDNGSEPDKRLNGLPVSQIGSSLTSGVDITTSKILPENINISFRGHERGGPFLIDAVLAEEFLQDSKNRAVIHPWYSGRDLTGRPRNEWVIDFGEMSLEEAQLYDRVLNHLWDEWQKELEAGKEKGTRTAKFRDRWWLHRRSAGDLRVAIKNLERFLVTPLVSKFRVFVWLGVHTRPDTRLVALARNDDYFFGCLHSKIHEVWSLKQSAHHGKGNDPVYNNTTCFETFPFPWSPGQEPTDHPAHVAISAAAAALNAERDAWLNPPNLSGRALKDRTLTNLYNALLVWRNIPPPEGRSHPKIKPAAGDFAPRLDQLHRDLDEAVCAVYGWEPDILDDEEEILRRLLALNLERAAEEAE